MATTEPFFHLDGDRAVPTLLCQGPWDPGAAHGGPPSALIARAVERHDPADQLFVTRISIDLLRPVPLAPLTIATRFVRGGKRVQIVEVTLAAEDETVLVHARALRVQRVPAAVEILAAPPPATAVPSPSDSLELPPLDSSPGIRAGVEMRAALGDFREPGPATCWFRMTAPLVNEEAPSPLQRTMLAADFGNGLSGTIPSEDFVFINPDLTVVLDRDPVGEWIALEAVTELTPGQGAFARGVLHDEAGRFGQSAQSLFIGPRG